MFLTRSGRPPGLSLHQHAISYTEMLVSHNTEPSVTMKLVVSGQRSAVAVKPRLHDTTCCQTSCETGLTTGCIVYTAGCQSGCTTRFANRVERTVAVRSTWLSTHCQTGMTTGSIV